MMQIFIWGGWLGFGAVIFYSLPYLPSPIFNPGSNKILRLQMTLFIAGWFGKLFAGALYLSGAHNGGIGMLCCALAALAGVVVLGCLFRKHPSKAERIDTLKKQIAALEDTSSSNI